MYNLQMEKAAAYIAHEVKNPLALIKANLQLLELEYGQESEKFSIIYTELDKIDLLVKNLLDLSKPYDYTLTKINLGVLIEEIIRVFAPLLNKNKVIVEFDSLQEYYIVFDEDKLRKIIINLIQNSIEAMRKKEKKIITITMKEELEYFVLIIQDTGEGINCENLNRIGTPFFTTKVDGNGIGLSFVNKVLKALKGNLKITSTLDEGTTFQIFLNKKLNE